MRHSLKIKFVAMMLLALGLATIPAAYISSEALLNYTHETERRSFYRLTALVEENILRSYMNFQKIESLEVKTAKSHLTTMAEFTEKLWHLHGENVFKESLQTSLRAFTDQLEFGDVVLDIYKQGFLLQTSLFRELARDMGRTDFKGDSLRTLLEVPLERGIFALFELDGGELRAIRGDEEDMGDAVLVLFYPLGDVVLCLARYLPNMDLWPELRKKEIIRELGMELSTISRERRVEVIIFNDAHEILVSSPGALKFNSGCIPERVFAEAKQKKTAEHTEPEHVDPQTKYVHIPDFSGVLYRVAHIRTLNWYLVAEVELDALSAPGKELARHLILVGLTAAALSLLGMLVLGERLTAPLRDLIRRARTLAVTDFSRSEAGEGSVSAGWKPAMTTGALLRRRDEVGQLAAAFAHMEDTLRDNIRHLVDVTRAKERMQGELDAARSIQRGILPSTEHAHPACALAALLEPAKEVGGDFYDFSVLPDGRMAVAIGDVSDKGVPAALFMTMTVSLVRSAFLSGMAPAAVLDYANASLCRRNPQNMFVTLWVGVLDPVTGMLDYANGGHCPPLLLRTHGPRSPHRLDFVSGPLVGALEGMAYEGNRLSLCPGDAVLLYSDGITEAERRAENGVEKGEDAFWGMDRLSKCLERVRDLSPEDIVRGVEAEVRHFRQDCEQSDDITMLYVRWLGPVEDI